MSIATFHDRKRFDVPCTVDIENSPENVGAHVVLPEGLKLRPGDRVRVHDAPDAVRYGGRLVADRHATVIRAGAFGRLSAKVRGFFDFAELYDLSFTSRRRL